MAADNSTAARVNFTAVRVREFTCPPGKTEATLWDTTAPGLGLRVRNGGAKSYLFQFRIHGKAARINIGSPDAWDIDQARAEARRLKVLVDQGTDPRHEKQTKAEEHAARQAESARQAVTLGEAWPRYIEARQADWGAHTLHDHHRAMQAPGQERKRSSKETVAGGLYALRDVRLADLTPETIEEWMREQSKTRPTVTARNYRLLRAFLGWAETKKDLQGLIPGDATTSPVVRRALPKSSAKDDALQREQLKAWFDEVRKIHNPVIAAYLQALLLTGARREEIAGLRWADVEFKWKSLTIRDKVEGERTIPLTPYLAALLADLKRRNDTAPNVRQLKRLEEQGETWQPSPWVFASPTAASGRITDARAAHTKALTAAGLPHVTIHGLRRSFGSLAEWVEVPAGIVAQIMGHKPSATAEKHYRVRPLDLLRAWHVKIEEWMLEQAGIEQPAATETTQAVRRVK